jgi:DNA-binding transcriptional MocR family regulator
MLPMYRFSRNIVLGAIMSTPSYTELADALAADIAAGRLKPGERLPPQRTFAYERGIAVSTASRVYAELLRRGLAVGEVGRGTFISGRTEQASPREPDGSRVDLEYNFPILPEQFDLMARCLAGVTRQEALKAALGTASSRGSAAMREVSAGHLARGGWQPTPDAFLFTGNGRQAIAATCGALVPVGGRLGVEAITYPLIKGVAARLGITLVPLAVDEEGLRPDALANAHRKAALASVYLQPALHNPLGVTPGERRREDLAHTLTQLGLTAIEDTVYGFLCDTPPLAAIAPGQTVVIDSLSKRIAPGLAIGFVHAPLALRERLMASIRSGGWGAPGYALQAAQRLIADGTATAIAAMKRNDAALRQRIAAGCLAGFDVQADPRAYHLWLTLPEPWRSEAFVAAAARRGIALTPSSAFTVGPGHAPNAVRLALASPPPDRLREALDTLARILHAGTDATDFTE